MPRKILIDADPGIGDAVAIAVALMDPEIDVVGITATAGSVDGPTATRNVQTLVARLDPTRLPRLGCSQGTASPRSFVQLNGPGGLGECASTAVELHHAHDSAKLIADVARSQPHEVTLLTLGPLTNVALACELAPDFLSLLKGLVCVGGSIASGGDVTAAAEFNMYANPEAARLVLRSPATKTLVPLDTSGGVVLSFEQYNRLPTDSEAPLSKLLSQLLPYAFRAHHQHLGIEGVRLYELAGLALIAQPQLFASESMAIDIETRGDLTRGMTVFDRRGIEKWQTNIDAVREVDVQGVLDYFLRIVRAAC